MATNIALATTYGADTGTGQSFEPWRLDSSVATFRELSAVAQTATITFKAVDPKKTATYAGSMRGSVKLRREYADSQGVLWPAIVELNSSLPAFLTDAQRAAFVKEALLLARETEAETCLSKLAIPQ